MWLMRKTLLIAACLLLLIGGLVAVGMGKATHQGKAQAFPVQRHGCEDASAKSNRHSRSGQAPLGERARDGQHELVVFDSDRAHSLEPGEEVALRELPLEVLASVLPDGGGRCGTMRPA
jgi:hypothetical protein